MSSLKQLAWYLCDERFEKCPFCGEGVDVFERPDDLYADKGTTWWIRCKTMGCLLGVVGGWADISSLQVAWNKRP